MRNIFIYVFVILSVFTQSCKNKPETTQNITVATDNDLKDFNKLEDNIDAYREFLQKYPDTEYKSIIEGRIAKLDIPTMSTNDAYRLARSFAKDGERVFTMPVVIDYKYQCVVCIINNQNRTNFDPNNVTNKCPYYSILLLKPFYDNWEIAQERSEIPESGWENRTCNLIGTPTIHWINGSKYLSYTLKLHNLDETFMQEHIVFRIFSLDDGITYSANLSGKYAEYIDDNNFKICGTIIANGIPATEKEYLLTEAKKYQAEYSSDDMARDAIIANYNVTENKIEFAQYANELFSEPVLSLDNEKYLVNVYTIDSAQYVTLYSKKLNIYKLIWIQNDNGGIDRIRALEWSTQNILCIIYGESNAKINIANGKYNIAEI